MHNLVQGENVMICCLGNIPRKRQPGFFLNQMNLQRKLNFPIWALSCLGLPGFCWQITGAPHPSLFKTWPSGSIRRWVLYALSWKASTLLMPFDSTPLRFSVYMPASLSQRTIEVRGVAVVYPQVSLTMLHQPILLALLLAHLVMLICPFSFWLCYLLMYLEQPYPCSVF